MRKDLNKQLCERPRSRSRDHYGNYRHDKKFDAAFNDVEDDGLDEPFAGVGSIYRESMKLRHGTKDFNENLRPLYGFIHKSVGKLWNDVYSEICEVFDKRSVINQHILIHLEQYVEIKTIFVGEDNNLWYRPLNSRFLDKAQLLKDSYVEYYVDPGTGVLCHNNDFKTRSQKHREYLARVAAQQAKIKRVINDKLELHNFNGSWFIVEFEELEGMVETKMVDTNWSKNYLMTRTVYPYRFDVLSKCTVAEKRVAISKRQLSHKELHKYNLTNQSK